MVQAFALLLHLCTSFLISLLYVVFDVILFGFAPYISVCSAVPFLGFSLSDGCLRFLLLYFGVDFLVLYSAALLTASSWLFWTLLFCWFLGNAPLACVAVWHNHHSLFFRCIGGPFVCAGCVPIFSTVSSLLFHACLVAVGCFSHPPCFWLFNFRESDFCTRLMLLIAWCKFALRFV